MYYLSGSHCAHIDMSLNSCSKKVSGPLIRPFGHRSFDHPKCPIKLNGEKQYPDM